MTSTSSGILTTMAGTSAQRKHPQTPVRDNRITDKDNILYIYNTRARTRVEENSVQVTDQKTDSIKTVYYMALGYWPAPVIMQQVAAYLQSGIDAGLIAAVLRYTGEHAPRPTWAYARSVIDRKYREGITTAAAFDASVAAWYSQRQMPVSPSPAAQGRGNRIPASRTKTVIEQQYDQREYDPAEVDGLTPEEIEEAMRYER